MFFSGLFQRKSDAPVTTPAELADAIGLSYDTYTGKQISSQRAMRLTAVFSCVRVLAESVGMLPCNLYHLNGSLKQRATGERLHKLISTHPNGYMTPQEFWELVVTCLCLRGNFYAYKVKAFGEVAELLPVDPGCVVTATPHLAVYDPTVQFEFWFSETRITDIRQVETTARYLGTGLYWIAASINIKPGHDYYFYIRSVNTVGKSAFVEAVGRASDDAEGYLDFFKGKITESHLGKELLEKVDLTEDNASKLEQFSKEWKDANDKWNAMWAVKIEQTKDGKHYVAGIGLSMEDTEEGKLSQFLVAANRIAFIDPANGNETSMFVAQGNQIFMNDVFLKRLTAPTITSGGNPPVFSLTPDGKLTAKNADISGSVNANSGTLNNVTINENCTIKGMLEANQVRGDFVKTVSKSFPKKAGTWGNTETPNGTVTVTISDDHNFDRQIIIPPIIFNGIAYSDPGSGNNPGGTRYTGYGFEVRKNGVLIASRETKGAIPGSYSAVIDMPSGRGSVTLEFKVFHKGNQWAGNITDCTVIVTKKAASGISIR